MRKLSIIALAAVLMLNAVPAFTQDAPDEQYRCKLAAGTCLKQVGAIQRKMKKLDTDIKKGSTTYTADELKAIELKLKEVEKMLDDLKAKK